PYFTGSKMPAANAASMMLTFSDKDRRKRNMWQVIDVVYNEAMATIPGIRRLQIKEMGSDVMATAAAPIHLIIYGPDLNELDRIGREALSIAGRMGPKQKSEIYQPATTWTAGPPGHENHGD